MGVQEGIILDIIILYATYNLTSIYIRNNNQSILELELVTVGYVLDLTHMV